MIIVDLLKWFSESVIKWSDYKEKQENKFEIDQKKFFETYIDPSFNEINTIHKDYIESFYELLKVYRGHKIGNVELIDFLFDKKSKNQFLRDRFAIYLSGDLINSNSFKKVMMNEKFDEISIYSIEKIHEYILSLSAYFKSTIEDVTWYSRLLSGIKDQIEIQEQFRSIEPQKILVSTIEADIESTITSTIESITDKFRDVCSKYSSVKSLFL
jgi:hypothetical protein